MKVGAALLVGWLAGAVVAQEPSPVRTLISTSGQFIIHAAPSMRGPVIQFTSPTNRAVISLEAQTLAVSCERIKHALLREIGLPDLWRGKIRVLSRPRGGPDSTIHVTLTPHSTSWQYQIDLPTQVESDRLVRGLVQVLLLEIANRNAAQKLAEVPLWLAEGLPLHLIAASPLDLAAQPRTALMFSRRKPDPIEVARNVFQRQQPLTFTELSQPTADLVAGELIEHYRLCAHLFIHELLKLNDGRAALRMMLLQSSQYFNWQTAFLHSFQGHFANLLAVEKWWAVTLANLTGRDPRQIWPAELTLKKLADLLRLPAQRSVGSQALPQRIEISIQQAIAEWDYPKQKNSLRQKISQLSAIRFKAAPPLLPLVDQYRLTLESYLEKRDRAGYAPGLRGQSHAKPEFIAKEAIRQLTELDQRRERGYPGSPTAALQAQPTTEAAGDEK